MTHTQLETRNGWGKEISGKRKWSMKTYTVLIIVASIILVTFSPAQAVNIDAVPTSLKIQENQEYIVNITINAEGQEVFAAQYDLIFDPDSLEAEKQMQGAFLNQNGANTLVMVNTLDNHAGKISYAETRMGTPDGATGSGILASVKFRAKNSLEEPVSILLQNVVLVNKAGEETKDITVNSKSREDEGNETAAPVLSTTETDTFNQSMDPSSEPIERVIAPDLLDLINQTNPDDKIAVIASIDPSSAFSIVQYLESREPDVSDLKELKIANAVAFKGKPAVILELSELPYVKKIELDSKMQTSGTETEDNSEAKAEKSSGFSIVLSGFLIIIISLLRKESK